MTPHRDWKPPEGWAEARRVLLPGPAGEQAEVVTYLGPGGLIVVVTDSYLLGSDSVRLAVSSNGSSPTAEDVLIAAAIFAPQMRRVGQVATATAQHLFYLPAGIPAQAN